MVWDIPDKGTAQDNRQSILFSEDLDVLVAGMRGLDCVLAGCACTAQGSPDMTVAVAKGSVLSNGALFPVTSGNVTIGTADATNPRIDLIVANSSGTKAVRAGTAAAAPKPPARSANDVVLARVWVPAGDTTISADQITDLRVINDVGPIVIKKATTAVTVGNNSGEQTPFSVVLPSGLFLTGKVVRVTAGGNFLLNSGAGTVTVTLTYGGTTLFSQVSGASTNDSDRRAWRLQFELVAQANNDQAVGGIFACTSLGAITPPATGIGIPWGISNAIDAFSGGAAVDSDAGDRTLDFRFKFSVANSLVEMVTEFAIAEIL